MGISLIIKMHIHIHIFEIKLILVPVLRAQLRRLPPAAPLGPAGSLLKETNLDSSTTHTILITHRIRLQFKLCGIA